MRIMFICGSFEPGLDGVGDYVRLLCNGLLSAGNEVGVLAFNDIYLDHTVYEGNNGSMMPLQVLRISFKESDQSRVKKAQSWIKDFDAEWLSLQFVIFSYDSKGLPFGLAAQLRQLGEGRKWHIMFHELWVGMARNSSIKHFVWGTVQKYLIKSLIKELRPLLIHTQSKLYQSQLKRVGIVAEYLRLFSNIPVYTEKNTEGIGPLAKKSRNVLFVVFGTIHPRTYIKEFVEELKTYSVVMGVEVTLLMIGKNGVAELEWDLEWRQAGFNVLRQGIQDPEKISLAMGSANFGISTSSPVYIEKSGTVATMLIHKLPVICIGREVRIKGYSSQLVQPGISIYNNGELASILTDSPVVSYNTTPELISGSLDSALRVLSEIVITEKECIY